MGTAVINYEATQKYGNIVTAETNPLTGRIGNLIGDVYQPIIANRTAALMGDSIMGQNLTGVPQVVNTTVAYPGNSWLTWAQARLGWLWDIQYGDQFAVGGTSCDVIRNVQLPLILAAHRTRAYNRVFISGGTNDVFSTRTADQVIADLKHIFITLANHGIIPVYIGVLPRAVSGGPQNGHRMALSINAWAAMFAATTGILEYIPCHEALADNSNNNGYILLAASADYLHPGDKGAYWIGEQVYDYYKNSGMRSILQFAQSQIDTYDAAYNKRGVCFELPNPYMVGGTTAPTGMLTAGTNLTWAVSTRTLANGQTKPVVNCTVSGASSGGYLYDDNTAAAAWSGSDSIAEGDVVYAQAEIEVVTGGASVFPHLWLVESNGVNNCNAGCLARLNADLPTIPDGTILTLRTPNITVRPYGGSGGALLAAKVVPYSSGAAGLLRVRAFEMRKVIP